MLLTGIDIVDICRIEKALQNESFFDRTYGKIEKEYLNALPEKKKRESAAGFFAAKEAFYKAFGIGITPNTLSLVQVAHKESGKPYFVLEDRAKKLVGDMEIDLSISHSNTVAAAVVVAIGGKQNEDSKR